MGKIIKKAVVEVTKAPSQLSVSRVQLVPTAAAATSTTAAATAAAAATSNHQLNLSHQHHCRSLHYTSDVNTFPVII